METMPLFSTANYGCRYFQPCLNKPVNNAFIRNFQLVQFVDLGTAWNGKYDKFERPGVVYTNRSNNPVSFITKAGGIGPFAGGYGFGARSTLLGYFLKWMQAGRWMAFLKESLRCILL